MLTQPVPAKVDVKKDLSITIAWSDGEQSVYPLSLLRSMCPCAKCKDERAQKSTRKTLLTILPGNYTGEMRILGAELVGNYALKLTWSDNHDAGIYSFAYLRNLAADAQAK